MSPYYPLADGLVEYSSKQIVCILTKLISAHYKDWDVMLPSTLWAYRTMYKVDSIHVGIRDGSYHTNGLDCTWLLLKESLAYILDMFSTLEEDIRIIESS